jgi:AcrR family transcriptional regulator
MREPREGGVREKLLAASFQIAMSHGVDAVSTRAVCLAAGVQAPTLYHHFGDRAGLIRAVVDSAFDEYFARKTADVPAATTFRQEVASGWDTHVDFARSYPGLYPAMYPLSGPQSQQLEKSASLLREGFDRLDREGALRPGVSSELATAALRAALRGVSHAVAAAPDSPTNARISALVRDAIISTLLNDT